MQDTIRVRPTQDGTYTIYRGTLAIVSGLSRLQAERYEAERCAAGIVHRAEPAAPQAARIS